MYAITSVSSSAVQMARVTNEVEVAGRNFVEQDQPQPKYKDSNEAAFAAVQATEETPSLASSAQAVTPVVRTATSNQTKDSKVIDTQQQRVNNFELEMIKESPQNSNARTKVEHKTRNSAVQIEHRPDATQNKLAQTPYMIVVVNQTLSHMQAIADDIATRSADPPENGGNRNSIKV